MGQVVWNPFVSYHGSFCERSKLPSELAFCFGVVGLSNHTLKHSLGVKTRFSSVLGFTGILEISLP